MLIYFFVMISIATLLMCFVNKIEPFSMPYIPINDRNITRDPAENLNVEITNPKLEYNQELINWQEYIKIQTEIRNAHEVKGTNPGVNPEVAKNLQWRIHRWSIWDYLPSLKNPYYCKVQQYNGKETCQPLTDKLYCSVSNVFKSPMACLQNLQNKKSN